MCRWKQVNDWLNKYVRLWGRPYIHTCRGQALPIDASSLNWWRASPLLTASASSVEGTGVYRQYLPPHDDSSDFGRLGSIVPQNGRFPAQDADKPSCKIWHCSFIVAGELVTVQTKNKQTVNDISTRCLSTCVDKKLKTKLTGLSEVRE